MTNNDNEGNNDKKRLNCGAANPSMEKSTIFNKLYEINITMFLEASRCSINIYK